MIHGANSVCALIKCRTKLNIPSQFNFTWQQKWDIFIFSILKITFYSLLVCSFLKFFQPCIFKFNLEKIAISIFIQAPIKEHGFCDDESEKLLLPMKNN